MIVIQRQTNLESQRFSCFPQRANTTKIPIRKTQQALLRLLKIGPALPQPICREVHRSLLSHVYKHSPQVGL